MIRSLVSRASSQPLHVRTPLVHSSFYSERTGLDVHLKLECVQPPGSFKIRGIGKTVQNAAASGATSIVCSSGGNAGLAAAYAARRLGIQATVVLPQTAAPTVIAALEAPCAVYCSHGGFHSLAPTSNLILFSSPSSMSQILKQVRDRANAVLLCSGGITFI